MCDNIMIKNKTLPLFEKNGIYNLKKRKYKNIDTLHEYNIRTQVLTKNVKCGNLWDTIKRIFKKGTRFAKDAFNYIDKSPILSTVKDIASDYVAEKTGINPNDYYNVAKDVINMKPEEITEGVSESVAKTMKDQYQKHKERVNERKKNPNAKKPTKREIVKDIMTNYKNNFISSMPEQKETISKNFELFSNGLSDLSAGSLNPEIWKKKGPLFLLSNIGKGGKPTIDDHIKDILKKKLRITDFKLTPSMNKLLKSTTESNGRLYMGRGDESSGEVSTGKKNNDKYLKVLNSLK